jgi:hypothetical protein
MTEIFSSSISASYKTLVSEKMAPIKVGIIGYGFSTKCFHLPFILPNPDLQVYAFLQRSAAPTEGQSTSGWGHCTVDFPQAKHYRTADEFFSDSGIDLVIVCTHGHQEFVERSLNAGKHGNGHLLDDCHGKFVLTCRQLWSRSPSLIPAM